MIPPTAGTLKGFDGTRLFYRAWRRPGKGVLVFIHGMGEHSGRYQNPVEFFSPRGFSCYALDLRGQGQSEGRRVYADSLDDFLKDIAVFLQVVEKDSKVFLVGHSFGGQLALNFVASSLGKESSLAGLIVSSPNVRLALQIPKVKTVAANLLSRALPTMTLGNEVLAEKISHDPKVVQAYLEDPLVQRKITTRLGDLVLKNQQVLPNLARNIQLPCLLLHAGDDQICSAAGTQDFFQKIPIEDKTLKIYEGYYHELFNEIGKERVFRDMEEWIENHL